MDDAMKTMQAMQGKIFKLEDEVKRLTTLVVDHQALAAKAIMERDTLKEDNDDYLDLLLSAYDGGPMPVEQVERILGRGKAKETSNG